MKLPKLLSFSGRKQSGKTLLAKICTKYDYKLINFADSLKNVVCNSLEISRDFLEENKDKQNIYNLTNKIKYISNEIDINEQIVSKILSKPFYSIREILQIIGTDLIRHHNKFWHINKIKEQILNNPKQRYCISDTRFLNEKNTIEELGGECWFIIRPVFSNISNHNSETELKWTDFGKNIIINNTSENILIYEWENYLKNSNYNYSLYYSLYDYSLCNQTTKNIFVMELIFSNAQIITIDNNTTINLIIIDKNIYEIFKEVFNGKYLIQHENETYYFNCNNPFIIENMKLKYKQV